MFNRLKQFLRYYLGHHYPKSFFYIYRMLAPPHHVTNLLLGSETEIVIEGYPRSSNTFAVVAFLRAQDRDVKVAHHLHIEAQILAGVARGLPVIVLIREPVGAIKSLMIRHPEVTPEWAAKRYVEFYSVVERVKASVVVADFETVIGDFGSVIVEVNKKFGTEFRPFVHTDENIAAVFDEIEEINIHESGGKETHVARPSLKRSNSETSSKVDEHDATIVHARELYRILTSGG